MALQHRAPAGGTEPAKNAADPRHWNAIADLYDVDRSLVNLENGYWGVMARPVQAAYFDNIARVNRQNSAYARSRFDQDHDEVRIRVASAYGASPDEIALTRNATEAMQVLIGGYNRLEPGDAVIYSDLEYESMQYAMNWLHDRRGAAVKTFSIPEPATRENVLDAYRKVLDETDKARLLLVTHLSHRTGLLMPVREIVEMARTRGVDVIVDAAHSWGQVDFQCADLGADFAGFNLHKWIGAPVGVGFVYIRKERLADIDRDFSDEDFPADDIRSRVHTGTTDFATVLTVPAALDFHQAIGARAKEDRLRYLRDYWVGQVRNVENVEILTPDDPRMHAAMTSFRIKGKVTKDDNDAIVDTLLKTYGILTVRRGGVAKGDCIRVTPALFTKEAELDQLADALSAIAAAA